MGTFIQMVGVFMLMTYVFVQKSGAVLQISGVFMQMAGAVMKEQIVTFCLICINISTKYQHLQNYVYVVKT